MKNNVPAFPQTLLNEECKVDTGMTLRDWFAGKALISLIQMADIEIENKHIAETSYQLADAMLAAREK